MRNVSSSGRLKKQVELHLAQLDFLLEAKNVLFFGPSGTGKTHLSIALAVQAARRGHRVAFATAHQWVQRLDAAQRAGRLDAELDKLRRIPLMGYPSQCTSDRLFRCPPRPRG